MQPQAGGERLLQEQQKQHNIRQQAASNQQANKENKFFKAKEILTCI